MAQNQHPSRPLLTGDLVQRLLSSDTDPKEVKALQALSKVMIKIFKDSPNPSYVPEAAALATVVTAQDFRDLFLAFVDGTTRRNHYLEYLTGLNTITNVLKEKPCPSHGLEAAAHSSPSKAEESDLFRALVNAIVVGASHDGNDADRKLGEEFNAIIEMLQANPPEDESRATFYKTLKALKGTADATNIDPNLLIQLISALHCIESQNWKEMQLGPLVEHLRTQLENAAQQAEVETQYRLVCTLLVALDLMTDKMTTGLSREGLHDPLLKQLEKLSKSEELRLAQAAGYAYQALLSIPNDEGPYQTLWRNVCTVTEGVANLAGAVSTMDPSKAINGLATLQDVPRLFASAVNVVRALSDMCTDIGDAMPRCQGGWYMALRCADFLIHAKAFDHLKAFVQKVPQDQKKDFMCGLYAKLEQAAEAGDDSARQEITQFLDSFLVKEGSTSDHQRVRAWVKLVAKTFKRHDWEGTVQPPSRFAFSALWNRSGYKSTIPRQNMLNKPLPHDLLEKAWPDCVEAHVFYADMEIRKYYLQHDRQRLMVERLSGQWLPMDQCYINLAIVEHSGEKSTSHQSSPFSLLARLNVGKSTSHQSSPFSLLARLNVKTPPQDVQVPLNALFDKRKTQNGGEVQPQRILIRGQAGVGKTTLCKKIVYDYLNEGMWTDFFDRLLWVPLRTLKEKSGPEYHLTDWLQEEYFRGEDRNIWAKAVSKAVDDPAKFGKTLFILDGLDEVSRELDRETSGLLRDLLNLPHVIITSRPGTGLAHIKNADLELETIGFYPEQVEAYIKKIKPNEAVEIQLFVQEHWLVQGLVRIPIQLEALCYSWGAKTANSRKVPTTMTTLYRAIDPKLWKKDAARLGKLYEGKPLTENTAKKMPEWDVMPLVPDEIKLLQGLAFTGLYNDAIVFDGNYQQKIWTHLGKVLEHLEPGIIPPSGTLAKLSFLRTSDTSSEENRSYHFLHLTFQEYFAAQYFAEHWIADKPLPCLALDSREIGRSGDIEHISTKDFLLKEKYSVRYGIFWRFVAGLLQPHGDGKLCDFFSTIEREPRDLLGPAHQRLVMHCLSEVVQSEETPTFARLRTDLEDQLKRWLLFECKFTGKSKLAAEMELPERILGNVLRSESEEIRVKVTGSLRTRPKIPSYLIELAPSWLRDDASQPLRFAILQILQRPNEALPENILKAVAAWLEDQDAGVRKAAALALRQQQSLSEATLQALAARLEDQDAGVRKAAASALGRQQSLSEAIIRQYIKPLYRVWLGRSFEEQLNWHINDEISCISLPEGFHTFCLENLHDSDRLRNAIQEVQKDLDIPLPVALTM